MGRYKVHFSLKRCLLTCCLLLSFSALSASNEELYAIQKTTVGDSELFLNGMGAVKKLNATYYIAALYLPEKTTLDTDIIFLESPKRLTLRFALNRVSARSFGREMAGGLRINNESEEIQAYRNELRKFIGLFKGIYAKGDSLTFDYVPKRGVTVRHNDEVLGTIKKRGFDKVLFKAWLGEKPFSTAFKKGLVGSNEDKYAIDLLRTYVDVKG